MSSFQVVWIILNIWVSRVMMCIVLGWEPVFTVGNALMGIYISIVPLADSLPKCV